MKFYDDAKKVIPYTLISPIPKAKAEIKLEVLPKSEIEKVTIEKPVTEKVVSGGGGGNSDY